MRRGGQAEGCQEIEATLGLDELMTMDDMPNLAIGKVTIKVDKDEGPQVRSR